MRRNGLLASYHYPSWPSEPSPPGNPYPRILELKRKMAPRDEKPRRRPTGHRPRSASLSLQPCSRIFPHGRPPAPPFSSPSASARWEAVAEEEEAARNGYRTVAARLHPLPDEETGGWCECDAHARLPSSAELWTHR